MGRFAADVEGFANLAREAQVLILHDALEDTLDLAQRRQQSMARGATSVKPGAIPVDTGYLAATIASDLNGAGAFATDQVGPTFDLTIRGMDIGDVAHFAWTAEYAMAINFGHGTYPGAHWVETAAAFWPENVAKAAARHKV